MRMSGLFDRMRSLIAAPAASAVDLRAALAAIDLSAYEAAVTTAEGRRAGLLLDGSDAELDVADQALTLARRERDRVIAGRDALRLRLADAEVEEAKDALDAKRATVITEADDLELALQRWPKLQAELIGTLNALAKAEAKIVALNEELVRVGRTDIVPEIEARVFPAPKGQHREIYRIAGRVVLPEYPGMPGWRAEPYHD